MRVVCIYSSAQFLTSTSRQQAHSGDSSALRKKMVLFINLLDGKGLSQEINEDEGSI